MKEVEIKYKVKSFKGLKKKLKKLGFEFDESEEFEDHYYTDKARKFIKNETCLRLRRTGARNRRTIRIKKMLRKETTETLLLDIIDIKLLRGP